MSLDSQIRAVLSRIHDPCSVASGRPLSVIDMGLVTGWTLDGGTLRIGFCVTFPGCTMAPHFTEAAARDLAALPGVARVEVNVDPAFAWGPERMRTSPAPMRGEPQAWRHQRQA